MGAGSQRRRRFEQQVRGLCGIDDNEDEDDMINVNQQNCVGHHLFLVLKIGLYHVLGR